MKRLLLLVLVVMLMFSVCACGSNSDEDSESEEATQSETAVSTEKETEAPEEPSYVIEAGGLKLKFPEKWKKKVTVKVTDDKAAFSVGKTKLFDLLFNSEEGTVLGTVKGDQYIVVSLVDYPLKEKNDELAEIQLGVNYILKNLEKDYDFVEGEALTKEDNETFDIKTPVVTLKYPLKWKDKVTVDVSDDTVAFSDGDTKLFDLIFKENDKGYLLGTYKDTPIYIIDYPVESADDIAMQADINVIIEHLKEDSDFQINE